MYCFLLNILLVVLGLFWVIFSPTCPLKPTRFVNHLVIDRDTLLTKFYSWSSKDPSVAGEKLLLNMKEISKDFLKI